MREGMENLDSPSNEGLRRLLLEGTVTGLEEEEE